MTSSNLIVQAFRRPESLPSLNLDGWDKLVRQARRSNLLASLESLLRERCLLNCVPVQAREHLAWSRVVADRHAKAVQWEVEKLTEALEKIPTPVLLLKGAAYRMARLPAAQGRLFSDIDIMVPRERLAEVEAALMRHGWATTHHDAYDQHYYRTWMHELPPMRHIARMTVVDVHHAIVPMTSCVHPDSARLWESAIVLEGNDKLRVLAPTDMVLHSAVHLFHDGEFDSGLRDLVDLHRLLLQFGDAASFWPRLADRARELDLARPLFYALRYTSKLLGTPIPYEMRDISDIGRPNGFVTMMMDVAFMRGLRPHGSDCSDWLTGPARQFLYIRANWLRMPPLLLARHLLHKAFFSPKAD